MMLDLIALFILAPLFLMIYGLIVFFDLIGTGIEYVLIGGGVFLAFAIIAKALHFTFSSLFGNVGEKIISIILTIPAFAVALSVVGVVTVFFIVLLAFPFIFITGALGVSWTTILSVVTGIIGISFILFYLPNKTKKV